MGTCTDMHRAPERKQKSCSLCTCLQNTRVSSPGPTPSRKSAKPKCKCRQKRQRRGTLRSSGGRAAYSRGPRTAWRSWVAMVAAVLFSQRSSWSFVCRRAQQGLHLQGGHGLEPASSPQQSRSTADTCLPTMYFSGQQQPFSSL